MESEVFFLVSEAGEGLRHLIFMKSPPDFRIFGAALASEGKVLNKISEILERCFTQLLPLSIDDASHLPQYEALAGEEETRGRFR